MEHARILTLIHQTAPALVADGDHFTQGFYQHLLTSHPALHHTFNPANQASGAQARSLLDAIVLFVTRYDELETLGDEARRIAAKHVSVDVQPGQYAAVGASLLATIQASLGAAATPEVMLAWELAYGRIAGVLVGLEAATYQQQQAQPGGWAGFKPFVVARVQAESPDVRSFYLVPQDGAPLPAYRPGQFISLAVNLPYFPYRQLRQYSLSDAPHQPYYRITVKRGVQTGDAPAALVSNYLHDAVGEGSVVSVHAPAGEFCLAPGATAPLVLLAGGLGITPFMAMLEQLAEELSARPVLLIHAVPDADHQPFGRRLRELAQRPGVRVRSLYQAAPEPTAGNGPGLLRPLDAADGPLTADHLAALLPTDWAGTEFYCCGPLAFMRHVYALLAQRGITDCHFEEFGPSHRVAEPAAAAAPPAARCPYGHQLVPQPEPVA